MPVLLLSAFIADLQDHGGASFARRVLQKTLWRDGTFRPNGDDHRYTGIADGWIRYVSGGQTAYRVVYIRNGDMIYLYRAGEHSVEDGLAAPAAGALDAAVAVTEVPPEIASVVTAVRTPGRPGAPSRPVNRFKRNLPTPQINREIFSRRKLPHKDIWLVAPFVNGELFAPTAQFGRLLLDQVEDGASVVLITRPPKDEKIDWMEKLADRQVHIVVYPRLHTKLYCFVFDDSRRDELGLTAGDRYSSLILVGSANMTSAGMALGDGRHNEELCYAVPEDEIDYVESYVLELIMRGYELPDVRRLKARGQWQKLGEEKW